MTTRKDLVKQRVRAAKARKSLEYFTTYTYPDSGVGKYDQFQVNWHHKVIFDRLEAWRRGDIQKLIITMPSRRGKSEIVCRRLIPWVLGHDPTEEILFATHTVKFAQRQGGHIRRVMQSDRYREVFPAPELENPTQTGFDLAQGGFMIPLGVGEGSAGYNASRVIIDDYHKNRADAASKAHRDTVWEAFTDDYMVRMYHPPSIIVMATRWHHDDLIGRILDSPGADEWHVLHFPEIMDLEEPPDYDPREYGEPLFPWWFKHGDMTDDDAVQAAVENFEKIKARNAFTAESIYQGRPSPREGGLFKREFFQTYSARPKRVGQTCNDLVISVDATFKKSSSSDFVSAVVIGKRGNEFYVLDEVNRRMDYPETKRRLKQLAAKWPRAKVLIETKANGEALVAELRRVLNRVVGFHPTDSKETRAQMAADTYEARQIFHPDPAYAPWVGDFEEDLAGFPGRAHDDRVDAVSQAIIRWTTNSGALDHLKRICSVV